MSILDKNDIRDLRHRITFQSNTMTPDGQGGFISGWADIATNPTVWGSLEPKTTSQRNFGGQNQYQRTHQCIIRYRSDITQKMRISFDSRLFQIHSVYPHKEQKNFLVIDLEENQGS